jgi:hypothetical protein
MVPPVEGMKSLATFGQPKKMKKPHERIPGRIPAVSKTARPLSISHLKCQGVNFNVKAFGKVDSLKTVLLPVIASALHQAPNLVTDNTDR